MLIHMHQRNALELWINHDCGEDALDYAPIMDPEAESRGAAGV
jgi:hypothetical protein